jgi:hypothetical protein
MKKTKEQQDRENEIAELKKAIIRAEGRGQFDTSYHTQLERLTNPPKEAPKAKEQ